MPRARYAARSEAELRNRELEATSVGAWATTLVAIYETGQTDDAPATGHMRSRHHSLAHGFGVLMSMTAS